MPMSDELAGATLNYSQKALEIAAELVKMVAPTVKQGYVLLYRMEFHVHR